MNIKRITVDEDDDNSLTGTAVGLLALVARRHNSPEFTATVNDTVLDGQHLGTWEVTTKEVVQSAPPVLPPRT